MQALAFVPGRKYYACWIYSDGIKTILYDGSSTYGKPPTTPAFLSAARHLGYGDDVMWHMIEHDLCHNWINEVLLDRPSVSLWKQAHNPKAYLGKMTPEVKHDEDMTSALQSALNSDLWGLDQLRQYIQYPMPLVMEAHKLIRANGPMNSEWIRKHEQQSETA